jgi:hypothetical protein
MNKIQVLIIPVKENPYMETIENSLEDFQKIVGGYIEVIGTSEGYNVVINEEGKLMDLEPNIIIHNGFDTINGQFLVALDDGEGEFASISEEQAQDFINKYVAGKKVE